MEIRLRKRQEQLAFDGKGNVTNAYEKTDKDWVPMAEEDFFELTPKAFMTGARRLIVTCRVDGHTFVLVSHSDDEAAMRKKYPDMSVIRWGQILDWFKVEPTDARLTMLPKAFLCLSVFSGARVV